MNVCGIADDAMTERIKSPAEGNLQQRRMGSRSPFTLDMKKSLNFGYRSTERRMPEHTKKVGTWKVYSQARRICGV